MVHPAGQRIPLRSVPASDPASGHVTGRLEIAADIELRPAAQPVLEPDQTADGGGNAVAERSPLPAVPFGYIGRRRTAGFGKVAAGIERRTRAVIKDRQRAHSVIGSAADGGPLP